MAGDSTQELSFVWALSPPDLLSDSAQAWASLQLANMFKTGYVIQIAKEFIFDNSWIQPLFTVAFYERSGAFGCDFTTKTINKTTFINTNDVELAMMLKLMLR